MGQGISAEEESCVGYRVLGVQEKSPASNASLVSFFDFVVAAGGVELKGMDTTFIEKIKAHEDKALECEIYNIKSRSRRTITITPRRNWGGQGMLGVTIRFDTYYKADEQLVRVLDIEPGSPAAAAGLKAESDYILGTAEQAFTDSDDLTRILVDNIDRQIDVYVYNTDSDEVRLASLVPTRQWGGDGCLGASVAHGYLHRLPTRCRNTNGISLQSDIYTTPEEPPESMDNPLPPGVVAASDQATGYPESKHGADAAHS